MTHRERMLAAIHGQAIDRLPWAPRLDLWYKANKRAGTLPPKYRSAMLCDIVDDLDVGFHAVVPDFRDLRSPDDDIDRGLGIYNLHSMPYRTILEGVTRRVSADVDSTHVEYHTPEGIVSTTVIYNEPMRHAGVTITHVAEHAWKTSSDYAPLGYIFDNARVEPNYDGYWDFARSIGDRGIAVGWANGAGSPMHLVQRELMPLDLFFFQMHDSPDQLQSLCEAIGRYFRRVLAVAADSPADVLFFGGNYDAMITYPPFFARHIEPWLREFADNLHKRGKFLLTHADGENDGLLEHYLSAHVDIADSVCPSPMTRLSIKEVRDAFSGRIAIMGGVPSVALLSSSISDREFGSFIDRFFTDLGRGDHLILGISDTTPPDAEFSRIVKIGELARRFQVKL